ncbi:hypothetical protein LAV44_08980 [Clostridium sporogenes]|uniref:hypothetical protein n=1 Tax=Clostridium sporogenes TaxID=1509 RepID=UPI002238EBEE|nr:hypothetical protein [Clostridium sporogenes]MCW6075459.1 hypothetical protein [Clostridium sporogenes]
MYNIYRLDKDNKIFEVIENIFKIEKDDIYTTEGNIISGILENAIATTLEFTLGDVITDDVENKINDLKQITDKEMIESLTKSLATLNIESQKKDTMINSLTKTLAELNIESKKKDLMVNTMAKTIAELNIKINKLEEGK